jgi:hypothetical protein
VAFVSRLASSDVTGHYRSHVLVGIKKAVGFRRRWSNKSDTAITAALNHLLDKQRRAVATQNEKDRRKA